MRKNATKLAAAVLSLAMVMTSVNMPASAAKTKVKLNKTKATLYVNGSKSEKSTTLKVTVNGKKVNATFKSSNTKVLTVAKSGKVTAKKNGTAKVTATYKKKKYNCTVTVKTYATSVSITSAKTLNLAAGKTATIKATVKPSTASNKKVSFTSSKKNVATVTSAGKVTAKKAGTATVTVKALGSKKAAKKATVKVNVKAAVKPSTEPTTTPTTEPTATPETPVATEGAITVTTNVTGAAVKVVSGTAVVATASAIASESAIKTPKVANGTYTVVVSKEGYISVEKIVTINGKDETIDIQLTKAAEEAKISAVSAIDAKDLTINATFTNSVDEAKAQKSTLTLTKGDKKVTAKFLKTSDKNVVTYVIDDVKTMKPGDATANGEYNVTSDTFETSANLTTTYEEALVGNMVAGFVTTVDPIKGIIPVANAEVSIKGGQTVKTNENGYYQIAATNGKKTVTAKKAGFVTDTKVQAVDINRNHVTSQNFVLEQFNIANVYAEIEVKDDKDTAVTGADVKLYDGSKLIGNLTTNAQGKVLFANKDAISEFSTALSGYTDNVTVAAPDSAKAGLLGTATQGLLETGKTYTIKVQKQIRENNLKDVHTIKTATFTVDNEYEHNVKVTSPTVKKINSFVVTNKFTDDAQKLIDTSKAEVNYELYTTVNNKENGADATSAQKLVANTTAFAGATDTNVAKLLFSNSKKDSATTELVGVDSLLPADATLPTGDYYLVIKIDDDKSSSGESGLSYVAVKISVTEGQKATATATIDTGYTRRLNSVIGLAKDEAGVNTGASGNLTNIQRGTTGTYEPDTDTVKAKHIVYQVMADKVKIPVIDGTAAVVPANAKGTYSFEGTYKNFYPTADYEFTTQGNYILTKSDNQNIKNIVNTDLNMETLGAWNIVGGTINVTGDLIGKDSSNIPKLTKVTVKDSTGKVVADKKVDIQLSAAAGNSSSGKFAEGDKLTFTSATLENAANKMPALNLGAGQYTVEYTLNGYLPVSTSLTSMAGLEKVSPATTANLVKDPYSEKAGVKGKITVKGDDGKYFTGTDLETAVKDGVATLINADGKIAGIGKIDAKGEYSVLDADATYSNKITAGVYTLAIRFKNTQSVENKIIKNVVIENNKQTEKNVETVQGGLGSVKATVQSDTYATIAGLGATAYDEAYAKETVVNISSITDKELLGEYTTTPSGKTVEFKNLSAGKYTINFTDSNLTFATGKENVVIQDVNQKLYPTYTYKYNGAGSNLVDINVKVTNTADNALVVVAKDKDGKIVNDGTLVKAIGYTNATKTGSNDFVTVKVPSGATYTVEVYTMSGNQVASKVVNVQTVATTIDMSTYDKSEND